MSELKKSWAIGKKITAPKASPAVKIIVQDARKSAPVAQTVPKTAAASVPSTSKAVSTTGSVKKSWDLSAGYLAQKNGVSKGKIIRVNA